MGFNPTNFCYLMISLGQEFWRALAGKFYLRVSYDVPIRCPLGFSHLKTLLGLENLVST